MKLQIIVTNNIELDVPEYLFEARSMHHFRLMLETYLRDAMMAPDWWKVNPYHLNELEKEFKSRRKDGVKLND